MRRNFVLAALTIVVLAAARGYAKELAGLKVLYVGSERASDYVTFLTGKVAEIQAKSREDFQPADAEAFDVVLLDWPQSDTARETRNSTSPLGEREAWHRPTVLLGSAGLNLAVAWRLKGGSGCTCLEPLAYELRKHEIFDHPFQIDRRKMVSIATPDYFKAELADSSVQVLPLVDEQPWNGRNGWCTYTIDFEPNPDVEVFCGGVNAKTPAAAGMWRQGNLLHFGFEPSPAEMNESGQRMLLNSIAYISRFSEDRPIAITPSPFAGEITRSRAYLARRLLGISSGKAADLLTPDVWQQVPAQVKRELRLAWMDENLQFLHPNSDHKLTFDEDLVALGVGFARPEFMDQVLVDLSSGDESRAARAQRLLERYVPCGPESKDARAWTTWWQENRDYAFASDAGDYRWYVDPLAKKRGVPAAELRGPKRAG